MQPHARLILKKNFEPLLEELEEIGRMHECRMSPAAVRIIAHKMRKVLQLADEAEGKAAANADEPQS